MPDFPVTHKGRQITATERAIHVEFNDDGSLRSLTVVGAREALGGEEQRTARVTAARAAQIVGAGAGQIATALRNVIREGLLDHYDDSRHDPEE